MFGLKVKKKMVVLGKATTFLLLPWWHTFFKPCISTEDVGARRNKAKIAQVINIVAGPVCLVVLVTSMPLETHAVYDCSCMLIFLKP